MKGNRVRVARAVLLTFAMALEATLSPGSAPAESAAGVAAAEEGAAKVDKGVQRSNVAGKVLAKISEKSKTSTEMVHAIFEASTQQNRDLERVEQAMTEVKEIVVQINRSTLDQQTATGRPPSIRRIIKRRWYALPLAFG